MIHEFSNILHLSVLYKLKTDTHTQQNDTQWLTHKSLEEFSQIKMFNLKP